MAFLNWLDKHFASNPYYWCADDLVWPIDHFPEGHPGSGRSADAQEACARPETSDARNESRPLH
jgi:hypothetical protein